MSRENVALVSFNRGLISPLALARTDLKRTAFSAETMVNWMPRVFGSMMLRPGWEYLGSSLSDAAARFIQFIFSTDDSALVELTSGNMRIWVDGALVTRPAVTTAITNGTFLTDLTGWTDADEAGGTSVWVTGGYMGLTGNGTAAAIRLQQVTVAGANIGVLHALAININRGIVTIRVGSTSGGDEYVNETVLGTGNHSLAFTPSGDFYVQFQSRLKRQVLVDSCTVEASGNITVTAPWAAADLNNVRYDQSGDVIFVACKDKQQRRIERRSDNSWSVVTYQPEDGPFNLINNGPITITPSGLSGNITLTASAPLFRSGHAGALFKITSSGQRVTASVTAQNNFTSTIEVTGSGTSRIFTIIRSGTWVATVTLQRSLTSSAGPWADVTTYTTNATITLDDSLDNTTAWYRIGVKTGDFTSGQVDLELSYNIGSIDGIVRLTGVTNSTTAAAEVFTDLGGTAATADWYEGQWSDESGWPTSVAFVEGRLGWSGNNGVWLSVSDAFDSFDDSVEGDSAPISRTIGSGPVDTVNWMLALQRLLLGAEGAEFVAKSSSFDEPLTTTNFMIKAVSTQGSAAVEAWRIDKLGIYVQRGGTRVMQVAYDGTDGEYGSTDLTQLCPEVTQPYVVRMSVQRQPDTRIHCVLSDGTVAVAIFDRAENVLCWIKLETDGLVEDVAVLPGEAGQSEDVLYYHVNRTINGSTKRYLERVALEADCIGGTLNEQADSFLTYSGVSTTTITGLSYLEGEAVVVWGDGIDLSPTDEDGVQTTYTVTGGQITLGTAVTSAVIGLPYTAQWKSTKLAYASGAGTALVQKKKVQHLGLIMRYVHRMGVQYGPDFDTLSDIPGKENEAAVSSTTVHTNYDEEAFEFEGEWNSDSRLCLQAQAPRPVTILAGVISVETHDKT
jgi:hypothetical protein